MDVLLKEVDAEDDFAVVKIAERKKPAERSGARCSQDARLVARVVGLARQATPLAEIDIALCAEGVRHQQQPKGRPQYVQRTSVYACRLCQQRRERLAQEDRWWRTSPDPGAHFQPPAPWPCS